MRPALKRLHSPDVYDLAQWTPPPGPFAILIQLMVGLSESRGEESFDVVVCNAEWIAAQAATDHIYDLRHHLVVDSYDYASLHTYFDRRVAVVDGVDWSEIGEKLGRLGKWEFEDYRA